jgi:competence ComEA-like helix-hairpin-helix protein
MMQLRLTLLVLLTVAFAGIASAELPSGPGREETVRACSRCHSPELVSSQRQTRDQWQATISKMANLGAEATDSEFEAILDYVAHHFGPEAAQPVNVNKATAVEMECVLELTRAESKAIVQYRQQNGAFKTIDDLSHVPGLDFNKVSTKKSLVLF